MSRRTVGLVAAALLMLLLGALTCSIGQVLATRLSPTVLPTRTPRPTWTRVRDVMLMATPTLDSTRFPVSPAPAAPVPLSTPQPVVPGQQQALLVPQGAPGQVMTVVVVIVTATPPPPPTSDGLDGAVPPPAPGAALPVGATPGVPGRAAPVPTPVSTGTPPPPVTVRVTTNGSFVRQGPGITYPSVTRLDQGTTVTVVGRNRAGDWWKICCVNGSDVWIADQVVEVQGPLWTVAEALNIPPSPMPTATPAPTLTPSPTATYAWPFRLVGAPRDFPAGHDIFQVSAVLVKGSTPVYGYKLRIRKTSTGQEWLSDGSETYWKYDPIAFGEDGRPSDTLKRNVKWDSNSVQVPMGDDVWEVTVTDGGGTTQLSQPVRITTSASNPKWYHLDFAGS